MNPAQSARLEKEKWPGRYCWKPGCLYRVYPKRPCPRHGTPVVAGRNRCANCGVYEGEGGSCMAMEGGHDGNSANPSGVVPVPSSHGHTWIWEVAT